MERVPSRSRSDDVWQRVGTVTDNGYNIFGTFGAFQLTAGVSSNSIVIPNGQLYQILDTIKNSTITKIDTSVRLFPAKVASNGGVTPTIKINSKYFKSIKSKFLVPFILPKNRFNSIYLTKVPNNIQ